ncbi:putative bifunctional lysine-specific demethylase and histidyl-hydroxylase NO66 isoform X1 [Apostichopus japonicus]|uniref:Bifunctional lysine-specific demethylase and histidyl-hydroxylase n=1 Tax=Stichopus japonicus TaxID=307972 RepID=A0A2G8LMY1_STIJA|nr:putative bifunctional lysine-specific demethylase and histidyl-hydroxylase NO66 isoform X1 [Apostichopus japonicus]
MQGDWGVSADQSFGSLVFVPISWSQLQLKIKLATPGKVSKAKNKDKKAGSRAKSEKITAASKAATKKKDSPKKSTPKSKKTSKKGKSVKKQSPKAKQSPKKNSKDAKKVDKKPSAKSNKASKPEKDAVKKESPTKAGKGSQTKKASPTKQSPKGGKSPSLTKSKSPKVTPKDTKQPTRKPRVKNQKKTPSPKVPAGKKSPSASVKSTPTSSSKKTSPSMRKKLAKEVTNKVELTPMSELRATKEASKDSMLVKITPLKPSQEGRKSSYCEFLNTTKWTFGKNGPSKGRDSGTESALLFEWLISPVSPQNFFDNLWEKKPLLVRRHKPQYFQGLFTTVEFNNILKENDVQYSKHLDITTYTDGKRETHNPEGRAHAPVVWDYFNNGCSVRLLNPQTYSAKVWKLLSTLQEHFGSFCGANVYLTPGGTQGFAPHYDDIEAFILQLEGRKRWRLYSPRSDNEVLPRMSSENFTDEEIGVPILDTVLEEGDVLYFPRGYIHQATPPSDTHSLHLTVSTCQKNTWGDFMEKCLHGALQTAMEEDLNFRLSLPRDFLNFMGVVNSDLEEDRRTAFISKIGELFQKLASYAPIDVAADKVGMNLIHSSLPPVLTDEEMSCMVYTTNISFENGEFVSDANILSEETEIQLIRRGVLRLITQEDEIQVHHCVENSRVYHGKPCQFFVIPPESAPGVEFLIRQYPKFVRVDDLPLEGDLQGKEVELASLLFEKGLIRTRYPLHTDTEEER